MQIGHIRLMCLGDACRLDTVTPDGKQMHAPVMGDIRADIARLHSNVAAAGFSASQCRTPDDAMLKGCNEPAPKIAEAFAMAMVGH